MGIAVLRTGAGAALALTLGVGLSPDAATAQTRYRVMEHLGIGASYLGIEMDEVTTGNMAAHKLGAERGVIVRSVQKGSPASEAALQERDVVVDYDGFPVHSTRQLARLVQETPAGRKVPIVVSRDGRRLTLTARIARREDAILSQNEPAPGRRLDREFEFRLPDGHVPLPEGGGRVFRFEPRGREGDDPAPRRAVLGVSLQALTDQLAEHLGVAGKKGVLVLSVKEGSPAAAAGLRAGDVIVATGDASVAEPSDVARALERRAGEKLELRLVRDRKELSVVVELPKSGTTRDRGFKL